MTIQIFNSILTMTTALKLNINFNDNSYKKNYFNNYILKHNNYNTIFSNTIEYHNLKCWKSRCFFNHYIDNYNDDNMIFSLDFNINKDDNIIKIDYLYVNNDFFDIKYKDFFQNRNKILKHDETKLIIESLIIFMENLGKNKNIKKIIIDVHNNLERYNYELKDLGFIINNNIVNKINPYWIQAEKDI